MKTSHEMAQSVLKKRDRILRRRRILTASIGIVGGTAAAAAALVITMNLSRPRGVDLIDSGTISEPAHTDTSQNSPVLESSEPTGEAEPQYLYNDVKIREDSGTGSPTSYDSLLDYLEPYFYEFTITKQYAPDEAAELTGEDMFRNTSTLFEAHIEYDWLHDRAVSMDILLAQAGNAESQIENYPLYGVGERYAAFFAGFDPESWNVTCPEMTFAVKGEQYLHIKAETIKFVTADGIQLGEEIPADEQYVFTTTSNNPVRYVRKYDIEELADFLRSDLMSRGKYPENMPLGYTDFSGAVIPDITPEERAGSGFQAMGERNVLLDTKQAGDYSVLLVGDHVTADSEGHSGMINCFKFGVELYDGNTASEMSGAHFDAGQGGYWLYTDRLSDYTEVFQFGDNYIVVLRYYESDGSCYAIFNAVKGGELYPELMGDYSAVNGTQTGVTTMLSGNLSADEEAGTITDLGAGISYVFDFDAISDTLTGAHYTALKSDISVSERLEKMWLGRWSEIAANTEFVLPQLSVFGFDLHDGSRLAAFVYPSYKSYEAVFYRISGEEITELGAEMCGTDFELLENSSGQYLHITKKFSGGAMNEESMYVDHYYYLITNTSLEPVLSVGTQVYGGQAGGWYVYENGESTNITSEEYENLISSAMPDHTSVSTIELDKDGDFKIDEYCAFEDDPEGLSAAVLSALG